VPVEKQLAHAASMAKLPLAERQPSKRRFTSI